MKKMKGGATSMTLSVICARVRGERGRRVRRGRDGGRALFLRVMARARATHPVLDLLADVAEEGAEHVQLEGAELLHALVASVLRAREEREREWGEGW
jgi:dihydroxyacetone kinase